jgi:hypothetical protein
MDDSSGEGGTWNGVAFCSRTSRHGRTGRHSEFIYKIEKKKSNLIQVACNVIQYFHSNGT